LNRVVQKNFHQYFQAIEFVSKDIMDHTKIV